ncbi:MAG: septum formation initiator family protein [Oscillospiraceae bacterium]
MATRKKEKMGFLSKITVVAVGVFALVQLVNLQLKIASQQVQLAQIQEKIKVQTVQNKEIERLIEMGSDEEYIKRIAMEKLGFAYSDEKIYIDISGS